MSLCERTDRFIGCQVIPAAIQNPALAVDVHPSGIICPHPCADPATVISPIHEEKTDMLSVRPDGDFPDKPHAVKSAVILQTT